MQNWMETKVSYVKIDQDGRERKTTETYVIDAVSFTDAEARIIQELQKVIRGEFSVGAIRKSNIIEIFPYEAGEWWYKVKISLVTIDEKAGREKRVNNFFLVQADDFKEALKRIAEGLSYVLVPYEIVSMTLTDVADIFPYFGDDAKPESAAEGWDGSARAMHDSGSMESEGIGPNAIGDPMI